MDNPLYPTPSTGSVIGVLLGITIWIVMVAVGGFVIYRILRANGYLTRLRQNVDGHATRAGYSHGLKDGEQRAQQRHEIDVAHEQINQLTGALTRVAQQLADLQRAMNRPSSQAAVDRDADRPRKDARPAPATDSALSGEPSAHPEPTEEDTSVTRTARRLGLRKPPAAPVEIPASLPQAQPTPPIPADVDAATTTTPPTPAPTSSS